MVTTAPDGTATVTFPAGLFAAPPVVSLAAQNNGSASPGLGFFAEIVSVSATGATIRSYRANSSLITIGTVYSGTVVTGNVPVHVAAFEAS